MSRRSFLGRLGLGAATVFVVADGIVAYRAYDQGVLAEGEGPAFAAVERWRSYEGPEAAVAAAVLAASAHNTQPWLFALSADRVDLYADRTRTTGTNDPLLRELHVSLGCALENLCLAAAADGLAPEVVLEPGTAADLVATIDLRSARPVDRILYRAIPGRRSNRARFRDDPVAASMLASMSAHVDASVSPARLVWLTADADRRAFGDLLVEATRAHTADDQQSRDSFAWWRSDWDAIGRHKDGLTIDGVGLSPLVRTLGKILPATSRDAADKTFLDRTQMQAESAAAFGVIVVDDPYALRQQLAGGRLVERLHLFAAANGLGFQHMNQITERIDRDRQQSRTDPFVSPLVGPGALAAFRIGRPTIEPLRSPRRPVEEVVK